MSQFLNNKKDIIAWLDRHGVCNYALKSDEKYGYVVDVGGAVNLATKLLALIPVKFNHVTGDFNCIFNKLSSLEFSPHTVGGNFFCSDNQLMSLKGAPRIVMDGFYCHGNKLTSVEGSPEVVGGDFGCYKNKLVNLDYCPENVAGLFYCHDNPSLGELQDIIDFEVIHGMSLKIKNSRNLENKLQSELDTKDDIMYIVKI